jgi:hypothetical protein
MIVKDMKGVLLKAGLLNKSSYLAPTLYVTKFMGFIVTILGHTLLFYLSQTWLFNKPTYVYFANSQRPVCWTKARAQLYLYCATKCIIVKDMIYVTLCVLLKSDLVSQQTHFFLLG